MQKIPFVCNLNPRWCKLKRVPLDEVQASNGQHSFQHNASGPDWLWGELGPGVNLQSRELEKPGHQCNVAWKWSSTNLKTFVGTSKSKDIRYCLSFCIYSKNKSGKQKFFFCKPVANLPMAEIGPSHSKTQIYILYCYCWLLCKLLLFLSLGLWEGAGLIAEPFRSTQWHFFCYTLLIVNEVYIQNIHSVANVMACILYV